MLYLQRFVKMMARAVLLVMLLTGLTQAAEKPNIVLILADDLGYGDPGCYNDQSRIPTPHIDQLAQQGLRFTDAHTPSSVCTPTRYGLLTGRYCWRTPLKRSVLWPWDPPLIEADRLTLPRMLGQHGYHTACIGKWHLGWDWPLQDGTYLTDTFSGYTIPPRQRQEFGRQIDFDRATRNGPTDRGFDRYFGDDVPNFPPYSFIENRRTIGLLTVDKPDGMFGHPGPSLPGWDLSLVLPTLAQQAVQYVEQRAREPEKPFFLYMPLTAPHTPIAPSPHFIGKSRAGWYGDFVHQVDWTVGQVLASLDRTQIADRTLVIFTSDNGSPQRDGTQMNGPTGSVKKLGHDPSRPWRGMKSDIWEGGHRVPFIARWPGRVPVGGACSEPIILTDLMRTIAALIGHPLPQDAAEDSFDFGPALFGHPSNPRIRDHLIHHSGNGTFAIRQGPWKLILGKGSGGFTRFKPAQDAPAGQLYNLKEDPAESHNLYREHPEIVERLSKLLDRYQEHGRTTEVSR
jgi:arylsulfatase A-like enzyme